MSKTPSSAFEVGDIIVGGQGYCLKADGRVCMWEAPPPSRWDGYFPPGAGLVPDRWPSVGTNSTYEASVSV